MPISAQCPCGTCQPPKYLGTTSFTLGESKGRVCSSAACLDSWKRSHRGLPLPRALEGAEWHCRASMPRGPQAIRCTNGEPGGTDERDHHLQQRPDTHWHSYSGLNVLICFHTGWQIALAPELPKCPSAVMPSPVPPSLVTQTSPPTTTTIQQLRINIWHKMRPLGLCPPHYLCFFLIGQGRLLNILATNPGWTHP